MRIASRESGLRIGLTLGWVIFSIATLGLGMGCASIAPYSPGYSYFQRPDTRDAWTPKITGWQQRERADQGDVLGRLPSVASDPRTQADAGSPARAPHFGAGNGVLREKYFTFRSERRRRIAREFADWVQSQAKRHYVADGPIDHWATLEETLRGDGDDCDGLELLTYHALRDLGFSEHEVYRSIVYRPSDGQHHMVTLWFEDRNDPWVIDPTGAMTTGMPLMSEMPEWVPLKVFSEAAEFTVHLRHASLANASITRP